MKSLTNAEVYERLGAFRANQPVKVFNSETRRNRKMLGDHPAEVSWARGRYFWKPKDRAEVYGLIGHYGSIVDVSELNGVVEITYLPAKEVRSQQDVKPTILRIVSED